MTDDSNIYTSAGRKFAGHSAVTHSRDEYVKLGGFAHVNSAESFHAIVKRSLTGSWHAVSAHHLQRYINEISFRWNTRAKLGFNDADRAEILLKGAKGKRLFYDQPNSP